MAREKQFKAPPYSKLKKLKLKPNPHVRTLLIEVGAEVQAQLEKKEKNRPAVDWGKVLSTIVY